MIFAANLRYPEQVLARNQHVVETPSVVVEAPIVPFSIVCHKNRVGSRALRGRPSLTTFATPSAK